MPQEFLTRWSARLLPAAAAHRWAMCPLRESDRTLTLAAVRQPDEATVQLIGEWSGRDVVFETMSESRLNELLAESYPQPHADGAETLNVDAANHARVLLAEDDMIQRLLGTTFLESHGFAVVAVSDGQEALDVLSDPAHGVSALATDLQMPRLSGEQLVRAVRAAGDYSLPIIVLPASDAPGVTGPLLDAGASDYFRKPIDPLRFPARVRAAIIRRSATQPASQ